MPADLWGQCCQEELLTTNEIQSLSEAGIEYWQARKDGMYFECKDCTIAACNWSVTGDMGAAWVVQVQGQEVKVIYWKVAGAELILLFRAEAAVMSFTIEVAPLHLPFVIYTDSMNVIQALQAWNQHIFFRDLRLQRNTNILKKTNRHQQRTGTSMGGQGQIALWHCHE